MASVLNMVLKVHACTERMKSWRNYIVKDSVEKKIVFIVQDCLFHDTIIKILEKLIKVISIKTDAII